ncbi:nitroreductase family protein [Chloroflexota bacterium]
MELFDVIQKRYSVRSYRRDPVEDYKLQQVFEAARLAPTADNRQPLQFIVINTVGRETELRRIYNKAWFVQAPILICACAIPAEAWVRSDKKNYCDVDVAIAMDHLILAATDVGLGTCWVAAFDNSAARKVLGLPNYVEPIAFTPLGYADDKPSPKKRKSLTEIIKRERWQDCVTIVHTNKTLGCDD